MSATGSIRSHFIWLVIGLLVTFACLVAAQLEETTLMRIIFYVGAGVGFVSTSYSTYELGLALRERRLDADIQSHDKSERENEAD